MQNKNQSSVPGIADVARTAERLLEKIGTDLARAAKPHPGGEGRLFFPEGIELISVVVNVAGVADVEVKVAGPKGSAGTDGKRPSSAFTAARVIDDTPGDRDVDVGDDNGKGYHTHYVVWHPSDDDTQTLNFGYSEGTPFIDNQGKDLSKFDVVPGGKTRTRVRDGAQGSSGQREYRYKYDDKKAIHGEAGGNSKIIIQ
jgi:hypothetical protein